MYIFLASMHLGLTQPELTDTQRFTCIPQALIFTRCKTRISLPYENSELLKQTND